mgnify:CR=1 FL=1
MALNGLFPVMLVDLNSTLDPTETNELNLLLTLKNPEGEQLARINTLKDKAADGGFGARIPLVLDGEIIQAQPESYTTTMVKQMTILGDNTIAVKSAANTVTINIVTKSKKKGLSIFSDLIFTIADVFASKTDNVARISYFGDNILIPNGYLTRLSKSSSANSEREVITMEIQKDLTSELLSKFEGTKKAAPYKNTSSWGG